MANTDSGHHGSTQDRPCFILEHQGRVDSNCYGLETPMNTNMKSELVVFQAATPTEGRNRVFVKSKEDTDGNSSLALVIGKDFRLGTNGESLSDTITKTNDLDRKIERVGKESKAAHRRLDNAMPSISTLETSVAEMAADFQHRMESFEKSVASEIERLNAIEGRLTAMTERLESIGNAVLENEGELQKVQEDIDSLLAVNRKIEADIANIHTFNEKVVLVYD